MATHKTGIEWTHVPGYVGDVWNPTTGCARVSPGCDHCYAFKLHDQRYKANLDAARASGLTPREPGPDTRGRTTNEDLIARARLAVPLPLPQQYDVPFSTVQLLGDERLTAPLRATQPHAYFLDSMSDLFHEDVPFDFIDRVFAVMALSQYVGRCRRRTCDHEGFSCEGHLDPPMQHIFMILTKRPERMREYLNTPDRAAMVKAAQDVWLTSDNALSVMEWPLPNVWLGTSVEDQQRANERIPVLLDTLAAVHFISGEPLLEAVELTAIPASADGHLLNAVYGAYWRRGETPHLIGEAPRLDWVICGGESGPGARPFDLAWARSLRDQCASAGVPFFMKQAGSRPVTTERNPFGTTRGQPYLETVILKLRSRHGSNPDEWPEDLRIREWPLAIAGEAV